MIRVVVQLLAAFALPLVLYAFYFGFRRWRAAKKGENAPKWEDSPWFWLVFFGAVLAVAAFLLFGFFRETNTDFIVNPPTGA